MLPIATLIALSLGYIVAGAILVETVFSWPGIGRAVYDAVLARDYPMLQGAFLVLTVSVVFFNLRCGYPVLQARSEDHAVSIVINEPGADRRAGAGPLARRHPVGHDPPPAVRGNRGDWALPDHRLRGACTVDRALRLARPGRPAFRAALVAASARPRRRRYRHGHAADVGRAHLARGRLRGDARLDAHRGDDRRDRRVFRRQGRRRPDADHGLFPRHSRTSR